MPCYDSRDAPEYVASIYKKDIDNLTRMLCGLCKSINITSDGRNRDQGIVKKILGRVPGLADWWREHQEHDRKREAHERQIREEKRQQDLIQFERLAKKLGKKIV